MSARTTIEPVDHAQASELYSAYWDRELAPAETERLEEHLGSCVVCRREFQAFRLAIGGLAKLEPQLAPQGFAQGVAKRVRKRSRGRLFMPRRGLDRIPYELFSVVMLALLVAVYVVMQLAQPGRLLFP